MKTVAKLLIKHGNDFLMMYRGNHPTFGNDPDLPGGIVETGESSLAAVLREVNEEIGLAFQIGDVRELYAGNDYSRNGTYYWLYVAELAKRPTVTISWEHSSFEWISKTDFIKKSLAANDTYMHMVADKLKLLKNSH